MNETSLTERPEDTLRRYAGILVAIREIHKPLHIYDECGHAHTEQDVAEGRAVECPDFMACGESYLYTICRECCADSWGDQTEACASEHHHGKDVPACATSAALEDGQ